MYAGWEIKEKLVLTGAISIVLWIFPWQPVRAEESIPTSFALESEVDSVEHNWHWCFNYGVHGRKGAGKDSYGNRVYHYTEQFAEILAKDKNDETMKQLPYRVATLDDLELSYPYPQIELGELLNGTGTSASLYSKCCSQTNINNFIVKIFDQNNELMDTVKIPFKGNNKLITYMSIKKGTSKYVAKSSSIVFTEMYAYRNQTPNWVKQSGAWDGTIASGMSARTAAQAPYARADPGTAVDLATMKNALAEVALAWKVSGTGDKTGKTYSYIVEAMPIFDKGCSGCMSYYISNIQFVGVGTIRIKKQLRGYKSEFSMPNVEWDVTGAGDLTHIVLDMENEQEKYIFIAPINDSGTITFTELQTGDYRRTSPYEQAVSYNKQTYFDGCTELEYYKFQKVS